MTQGQGKAESNGDMGRGADPTCDQHRAYTRWPLELLGGSQAPRRAVCGTRGSLLIVMYGCESWTIKKAECQRIDAFELWCKEG